MTTTSGSTRPPSTPGDANVTQAGPTAGPVAWTDAELANPHQHESKGAKVRDMFSAIARSYDLNNRLHSFGLDQAWRRAAVRAASVRSGDVVLDVACGTGDLTQAFAATDAARVIGIDFTPRMLDGARDKQRRLPAAVRDRIEYREGDATKLEVPDASVDVVSIAFGIRNVNEPARAIAEFRRVLRPGGRLVVLEFDRPAFPPVRWANDFYSGWVMPRTATLISGDRSGAYRYLPKSVEKFMSRRDMLAMIGRCGFTDASARSLTLGVCALYRATAPASTK